MSEVADSRNHGGIPWKHLFRLLRIRLKRSQWILY